MKLFRSIMFVLFMVLSFAAVAQDDKCECFWLVLDDDVKDITFMDEAVPIVHRYYSNNKLFLQVIPQKWCCWIGPHHAMIIFVNDYGLHIDWKNWAVDKPSMYINLPSDAILYIPERELPNYREYLINVELQPCESFDSFIAKFKSGKYKSYEQPSYMENKNHYEADGFQSLKDW